jgi:hypothetical protein
VEVNSATDRGVGEGIGYVLALGVLVTFVSGLLFVGGNFFEGATADVAQDQVVTEAQSLAGEIESVDRDVRASTGGGEVRTVVAASTDRGNENFRFNITHDSARDEGVIYVLGDGNETVAEVEFRSVTPIDSTVVSGEQFEIVRPSGASTIEVNRLGGS